MENKEMNTKVKAAKAAKMKKEKRDYPLGGMGLNKNEETTVEGMLKKAGVSLKFVQRNFFRQWMAGEIQIKLE